MFRNFSIGPVMLRSNFATAAILAGALGGFMPLCATAQAVEQAPAVVLGSLPFSITVSGGDAESQFYEVRTAQNRILSSGVVAPGGKTTASDLRVESSAELPLSVQIGTSRLSVDPTYAPGWYSLVPPLIAIVLALLFKEVITALFAGIFLGALALTGFNPITALWRVIDQFAVPALGATGDGKTQIVVFSLMLGGMVGVIARNGGTRGIVEALRPFATSRRRGKVATWAAGLAIFFDDYANTLLVGNTMRPITDRLKISREKLAYLVDSTAAPVAAIVPISTWVGYEISLIANGLQIASSQQTANPALAETLGTAALLPLEVFFRTIPHLFYPLFALAFVLITSIMNRDLGPMAVAEARAASGGGLHRPGAMLAADTNSELLEPPKGVPHRWLNAGIPVFSVILVVLIGLYTSGRAAAGADADFLGIIGAADPFATLLWGSLAGCLVAILLTVGQRILTLRDTLEAWVAGMKAMVIAIVILVLAWSLGAVTQQLGTAAFLAQLLEGQVALPLMPALVFVVSAAMAFATGTSWATMAIMLPLVIPLVVSLDPTVAFVGGVPGDVLLGSISSVLAGAIFGDHCSPISDTTVLSSMASSCDHIDHVRTQLPYALLVGFVALLVGSLGTAYGLPTWGALVGGVVVLILTVRIFGRETGPPAQA